MATLTFLGATGTVTGSKYLLEAGNERLMIDCGLFQGDKELRLRNWNPLPVPPASIQWLVLTHAHLDHVGYIPRLVKDGFRGQILASSATVDLTTITYRLKLSLLTITVQMVRVKLPKLSTRSTETSRF